MHKRAATVAFVIALGGLAATADARPFMCTEGTPPDTRPKVGNLGSRRVAALCDVDGVVNDVCAFTIYTWLTCGDCPTFVTVEVPLHRARVASRRVTVRYHGQVLLHGRVLCRRAARTPTP